MMQLFKNAILSSFAGFLLWASILPAGAAIQLDNSLRPQNLPDISVEQQDENTPAAVAATQPIIIYVGEIVSRALLFAGSVSMIFLIMAGAQYILAFGKDERIERGKRGMTWSVIGLVVILLSYAIVQGIIRILIQLDATPTS